MNQQTIKTVGMDNCVRPSVGAKTTGSTGRLTKLDKALCIAVIVLSLSCGTLFFVQRYWFRVGLVYGKF
ncbi:MAG: hypothetical protein HY537_09695 [Deltaproteobacteria bacterium]|nr:hypothetical protein [Deltaproteobacteria bacterium]